MTVSNTTTYYQGEIIKPAPITLAEVSEYLCINDNLSNRLLQSLINTAVEIAEKSTLLLLREQIWTAEITGYVPTLFTVKYSPIAKILSVELYDYNDRKRTLDPKSYRLAENKKDIIFSNNHLAKRALIRFVAGFQDENSVPASLKLAILEHIASLYDNRGSGAKIPAGVLEVYRKFKPFKL